MYCNWSCLIGWEVVTQCTGMGLWARNKHCIVQTAYEWIEVILSDCNPLNACMPFAQIIDLTIQCRWKICQICWLIAGNLPAKLTDHSGSCGSCCRPSTHLPSPHAVWRFCRCHMRALMSSRRSWTGLSALWFWFWICTWLRWAWHLNWFKIFYSELGLEVELRPGGLGPSLSLIVDFQMWFYSQLKNSTVLECH